MVSKRIFPQSKYDVLKFKCPLTLQIWFFASEVQHHCLQLAKLTMGWVNVGLTVGPTSTHEKKSTLNKSTCENHRGSMFY